MPFAAIEEDPALEEEAIPVWEVVYFYERLLTLSRHGQVVKKVVPGLFGEVFVWWYVVFFRQQLLPTKWKSAKDIEALFVWMRDHTNSEKWSEWIEKQEADYDRLRRTAALAKDQGPGVQGAQSGSALTS